MEAEVEDIFHQEPLSTEQLCSKYYDGWAGQSNNLPTTLPFPHIFEEELASRWSKKIWSKSSRGEERKKDRN